MTAARHAPEQAAAARAATSDPERIAERLLNSAARSTYDPAVDVDWDAPLEPGRYFLPPERVSLYGTPLWDRLTEPQRIELSRQEMGSTATTGVWFEMVLMQLLLRDLYARDTTSRVLQWGLTEIADECRHSVMFGRLVETMGMPSYPLPPMIRELGRLMKTIGWGPSNYAGMLIAEEVLDRLQRQIMADDSLQPVVRMTSRIHVLEEARHISFARAEIMRRMRTLPRPLLGMQRARTGAAAYHITNALIHPACYRAVGLDPREARSAARRNPHHRETMRWAGQKAVSFLREAGLLQGDGGRLWRASMLLG